jgi:hypothetical protein
MWGTRTGLAGGAVGGRAGSVGVLSVPVAARKGKGEKARPYGDRCWDEWSPEDLDAVFAGPGDGRS